jgi:hypothetical protein
VLNRDINDLPKLRTKMGESSKTLVRASLEGVIPVTLAEDPPGLRFCPWKGPSLKSVVMRRADLRHMQRTLAVAGAGAKRCNTRDRLFFASLRKINVPLN